MKVKSAKNRTPKHEVWLPRVKQLRIARAESGVKVTQMAKDLDRTRSHVSDILNGRRTSSEMAKEIAAYFEKPCDELFVKIDLENPNEAKVA